MNNSKIQIYVVSHREEDIIKIKSDNLYTPLFVGCNGKENLGFCSDDNGDNISYKNKDLSELTGLYWIWKNTYSDVVGLCHYRRYFKNDQGKKLSEEDILNLLCDFDILMPKKTYLIKNSLEETYKGTYFITVFSETRKIIEDLYPEYLYTFDRVMKQDSFSCYNMFVAPKHLISNYCSWVFPIIEGLEENINLEERKRIIGVITEYLFNVWVTYQNLQVKELNLGYVGVKLKLGMFFRNNWFFRQLCILISRNSNLQDKFSTFFFKG